MSASQLKRLESLERTDSKSIALFTKCTDGTYAPWDNGPPRHYGNASAEDANTRVKRPHIDELLARGQTVIIVNYEKKWIKGMDQTGSTNQ